MIIYIIIGLAIFSITIKAVKFLDNNKNEKEQNSDTNNTNMTIKDGMNLYFGQVLGKLIIIILIIIIIFILFAIFAL